MENEGLLVAAKGVLSCVGGALATILGGWDALFTLFCFFVILDYITGIACAFKQRKFRSSVMRWGAFNKLIEVIIIALFYYADVILETQVLRNGALCWFLICEGSSIVENCVVLKVPLPTGLEKILQQLKKTVSINFTDMARKIIDDKTAQEEAKVETEHKKHKNKKTGSKIGR